MILAPHDSILHKIFLPFNVTKPGQYPIKESQKQYKQDLKTNI